MSDEIMLVFGEDGVARKYDDAWDITIHCESEEEQKVVLEKLNNSNQEPQWIPCSEGLPETPDEVLTTYIVNGNREKRYVETATWYEGDDGSWSSPWDEYRVMGTRVEVIAWMPLPKPYKEEDGDKSGSD